ncbi:MAG: electron transfer flavoprotein subunit beta/FixA family protein [Proteobacteria bacterium]|nr:electron transfer flavoprotein subunit beta/FixA family protein [Pseudomonadota bacterium]
MRVVVCLKQVIDPLTPASTLALDRNEKKIRAGVTAPPVINGFDEQGLEAALRLRETNKDIEIICLAAGERFSNDVMKRSLAVGADQLILVQDPSLDTWDPYPIAAALAAAIRQIGGADLVICGRQGSDWDNALTPYILADLVELPLLTLAKSVTVADGKRVEIERVLADGSMRMNAQLPALVTVTSELGALRMPTVSARLAATRKQPRQFALAELGTAVVPGHAPEVVDLAIPVTGRSCTFIDAADGPSAGVRLAETLLQAGAIRLGGER